MATPFHAIEKAQTRARLSQVQHWVLMTISKCGSSRAVLRKHFGKYLMASLYMNASI